jgi:hypothetical protein
MAACGGKVRSCPSVVYHMFIHHVYSSCSFIMFIHHVSSCSFIMFIHHVYSSCLCLKSTLLQVVVAGGINFETDLDDVWVADVPDTRTVYAAAAAAAAIALQSNGGDDQ